MPIRRETTQVEGGTMRLYVAVPERAGLHPGLVVAQHAGGVDAQIRPSPFERSAGIQCPVIGFHGSVGQNPSPADVDRTDVELTRVGTWHAVHRPNNAGHLFQNFSNRDRYRERAARASWHEMLAFFNDFLKRGAAA